MHRLLPLTIALSAISWLSTIAVAPAQLPALRNTAPEPAPRSVATAIVPTATVAAAPAAAAEVSLSGQIARTKQVDVRPGGDKVIAVLLDTGNGQQQIVDLGPAINWKNRSPRVGDQITVRGPVVTLGNASVLLAGDVYIGADIVPITRVAAAAVAIADVGYPIADQIVRIDGRIENLRTVTLRGKPGEHLVAEVVDNRRQIVVVDLGPPAALWRADLKPQDSIRIEGEQMNVNNRPVILALQINKNGLPYIIDREAVHEGPAVLAP